MAGIEKHDFVIGRLVSQGGFAGEGVVHPGMQLKKFRGKRVCATYNLSHHKSAIAVLEYHHIGEKNFVSKNVCHGVYYDNRIHEIIGTLRDKSISLNLIWRGMDHYLKKHPEGKKFHDPLAACCAIDKTIGTWAEVELFHERGDHGLVWGAKLAPGSKTLITVAYDRRKFIQTLSAV